MTLVSERGVSKKRSSKKSNRSKTSRHRINRSTSSSVLLLKNKSASSFSCLTLDRIHDFLEEHLPEPFNRETVPNEIKKYFERKSHLFSKYHLGVRIDYEGWFSVTPEGIAQHTAERCHCDLLVDLFAGVGGNTIQFAKTCKQVIAVEHDSSRLACTIHNSTIYDVSDVIKPILMDAFEFLETTEYRPNIIFLSPPWGGPEYIHNNEFFFDMLPISWSRLLSLCLSITPNLVMYLPRNLAMSEIQKLAKQIPSIQVEQVFTFGRPRALTIYTGYLAKTFNPNSLPKDSKYLDFSKHAELPTSLSIKKDNVLCC